MSVQSRWLIAARTSTTAACVSKPHQFSTRYHSTIDSSTNPKETKEKEKPDFSRVRGMEDYLPNTSQRFAQVENVLKAVSTAYGFGELRTPVLEGAHLFKRTLGDTSDVVSKEMYQFDDHGRQVVLRPEGTAGAMRALCNAGVMAGRFYYLGPMFRRERPQKGRYRQFTQFGVEAVGESGVHADVEVIELAALALDALGILKHTVLYINSLGAPESRIKYQASLREALVPHIGSLSPLSQSRLTGTSKEGGAAGGVLRVLDSKEEADKQLLKTVKLPVLRDFLSSQARDRFDQVCEGLNKAGIKYEVNPTLMRGLDYYTHTAFEFIDSTNTGRQNAVLAGGRYDGLLSVLLNNPTLSTPGVGWAAGVDRLVALLEQSSPSTTTTPPTLPPLVVVIPIDAKDDPAVNSAASSLARQLRSGSVKGVEETTSQPSSKDSTHHPSLSQSQSMRVVGGGLPLLRVVIGGGGPLNAQLRKANQMGARWAVLIGSSEVAAGTVHVKDLGSGVQSSHALSDCTRALLLKASC